MEKRGEMQGNAEYAEGAEDRGGPRRTRRTLKLQDLRKAWSVVDGCGEQMKMKGMLSKTKSLKSWSTAVSGGECCELSEDTTSVGGSYKSCRI